MKQRLVRDAVVAPGDRLGANHAQARWVEELTKAAVVAAMVEWLIGNRGRERRTGSRMLQYLVPGPGFSYVSQGQLPLQMEVQSCRWRLLRRNTGLAARGRVKEDDEFDEGR